MIRDITKTNEDITPNSHEIEVLKENFPSCFRNDGSFDLERFKGFLSDKVAVTGEGYELKFLGKNYARLLASIDTTTVVVPDEEHNCKLENATSENVYISGDNLDGLKHLLKSYARKVDCIYIDPPYNTGKDGFVYNDTFNFSNASLAEKLSITEEQAQRILDMTKFGSSSHSAWLMFLYTRLQLARDLLSNDGIIVISIDDNEQANLKLLCDDVFGEENQIGSISVLTNPKGRSQDMYLAKCHEYLLIYSKFPQPKGRLNIAKSLEQLDADYTLIDEEGKSYRELELRNTHREFGKHNRPNLYYPIYASQGGNVSISEDNTHNIEIFPIWNDGFEGCWTWGKDKAISDMELLCARCVSGNWKVYRKDYAMKDNTASTKMVKSLWIDKKFHTEKGQAAFNELFKAKGKIFDAPKPIALIAECIKMAKPSIMLDFFSGSATTAHAVMQMNTEENANCKYILVQLPENARPGSEAQKAGYETIDQIGIERIIRAAKVLKEENPNTTSDLGFKHYSLAEPPKETLDKLEKFESSTNALFTDSTLLDCFGKPTVLATWLVRDGYGLTVEAEEVQFAEYTGYHLDKHLYLINPNLSDKAIEEIVVKYETDGSFNPENVVLFGYSFTWTELEALQTNLKRLIDTEKNLRINFDIRY